MRQVCNQQASKLLGRGVGGGGALVEGWEKEGELATTSLEFEWVHPKSQCGMLIGGDDISNDVITLGMCFSMFVYIRARFRFALIGGNLTAQLMGSHIIIIIIIIFI